MYCIYTLMAKIVDSRILIRNKFLKQSRNSTIEHINPQVNFIGIPEESSKIQLEDPAYSGDNSSSYLIDDPLSREFHYNESAPPPIFVCLYTQHTDLTKPYISYYLINNTTSLDFPSNISQSISGGTVDDDNNNNNENDTDELNDDKYIQPAELDSPLTPSVPGQEDSPASESDDFLYVQGSQYVEKYLLINDAFNTECYKGFIELDGNVYTFFDVTELDFNPDFNLKHTACVIDEIVNKKQVYGIPIAESIQNLFVNNNTLLYNYHDNSLKPIASPICVYACENDSETGKYINSKYIDVDDSTLSLLSNQLHHPVVGQTYLFTSTLLDPSSASQIKRFALFHSDAVYVLHEPFLATEYELIVDNECVCFLSEGIEYWSVKNRDLFSEI